MILILVFAFPFYRSTQNQIPIYSAAVLIKTNAFAATEDKILSVERQLELLSRTFLERVAARMGLAIEVESSSATMYRESIFSEVYTTEEPTAGDYEIEINEFGQYFLSMIKSGKKVGLDSANVWDAVEKPRSVNGVTFRLNSEFVQNASRVKFKILPFGYAVSYLKSKVNLEISRSGATMKLSMTGTNPDVLPAELNRIAETYVEETKKLKRRDLDNQKKLLMQRMAAAEEQVKKAEEDLKDFNTRYPLSLNAEKQAILGKLHSTQTYLRDLPLQRQKLTDLLDEVDKEKEGVDTDKYRRLIIRTIANFAVFNDEPQMAILRQTLEEQETRYNDMVKNFSENWEPVIDLKRQIKDTEEKIIKFASKYRNTLAQQETDYRKMYADIQTQLKNLPRDEYQLMELQRNKDVADGFYNSLYSQLTKTNISEIAETDEIAILDRAVRPGKPINPSTKRSVLLGSSLGFLLGIILSVIWELTDKTMRTVEDVERSLRLPVIGAIPVMDFKDVPEFHDFEKVRQIDKQLVTDDYSATPVGEAYRALRTHLMFSKNTGKFQSLLITSISPEDGKSFTSSNLAIIVAQQKTNTLLVDADLRRGVLHNTFGLPKDPGFTNYLTNKITLLEAIQPTHIPNLSLISCGSMIPNPSELLGSLQLRRFLEDARRKFDVIIFDTPPLDAATDAVVLGTQVDAMAVVVRSGKTSRTLAKEKLEIFETVPVKLIGIILNGSETALVHNYSYYHY